MKAITLDEATLTGVVHQAKNGSMRAQLRVAAVLSAAECRKLHISLNGFKAVELDQEFEAVELKFVPPDSLKSHQLAVAVDRAAKFKVREHEAKEGQAERQVLEFIAYASGAQFEAVQFMATLGSQTCRLELSDRQGELFPEEPPKRKGKSK